jgi:hypothetical protein
MYGQAQAIERQSQTKSTISLAVSISPHNGKKKLYPTIRENLPREFHSENAYSIFTCKKVGNKPVGDRCSAWVHLGNINYTGNKYQLHYKG